MTVEMGNPGVSGYGYTNQDYERLRTETDPAPQQGPGLSVGSETAQSKNGNNLFEPSAGSATQDDHQTQVGEEITLDRLDEIAGYEASASACIKRARQVARSLNHASIGADHLMLSLTMDQNARRLLERVGDVSQLREAAMRKLGHYGSARDANDQSSVPTSDLADIAKAARDAANEREQSVALSDLINAFPKLNGRLTYGSGDTSGAMAVMQRIENGLVPRVADSITRIETLVFDAVQQSQTAQKMLQDLNSRQTYEAEQQQVAFMEAIRCQVREAVDRQVGTALREFGEILVRQVKETKLDDPVETPIETPLETPIETPLETQQSEQQIEPPIEPPKPRTSQWGWLALL